MKRLLFAIILVGAAHASSAVAETVSVTVNGPSQEVTVQPISTTVTPEVVTVTAEVNVTGTETVEIAVPGPQGIPGTGTATEGGGVPPGGTTGQALVKASTADYDTTWADAGTGSAQVNADWTASGSVAEILNKPEIPIACVNVYDGRDGAAGPTGATGATGPAGTNGLDGKTVLNGFGAPGGGLGVDGDFYLDTANAHLYGPKAAGAWGTYIDLVGPQGPQGPPGPSASVTQSAVLGALDDATDGAVAWVQQGPTEQATDAKIGVKDRLGNAKEWVDSNGTMVRQCITSDSAPAFKMLSSTGTVIYSVACDNTMTFTGTVTIK